MTLDWFKGIYTAAGSFYKTIMGTDVNDLLTWLDTYRNSCIKEQKTLAYGISLDIKTVKMQYYTTFQMVSLKVS